MEEFKIIGSNGHLLIKFIDVYGFPDKTCHWGGYDTQSSLEISCSGYSVKSFLCLSTGNVYELYKRFENCFENLEGEAYFESYESNLKFEMKFDKTGKVNISGKYIENYSIKNELKFELQSDQSYLSKTLSELKNILKKYGNETGIRNVS